ncbi:mucin-5AC [Anopheles maculipalpis]|uniref:mucin-5AC n=1 Tax=Anopheles maculipalpis TaxID=1496333 RepID=UPI0021599167|nr:mucin-5AC [Anopheles maculipalpis]
MGDALGSWAIITLTVATFAITICPSVSGGERWSRQLTEFTGGPVTGNDWIPLSRPGSERQAGARVLNYFTAPQQTFLDPDSAVQAQQHHFTFLNHQFPQSNRFLLQQPTPQQQPAQELIEQPFHLTSFQRTAPFVGQTIQHPPPPLPQPASSTNPFEQQFLSKPPVSGALIQDDKQQSLLQQRQQQQQPSLLDQPFSYQPIRQPDSDSHPPGPQSGPSGGAVSQEEVQLLYVPVETLYNQKQPQPAPENNRFNTLPQPVSPSLINDFYTAATTTTTTPKAPRTSAATFAPHYSTAPDTPAPSLSRSSTSTLGGISSKPKPNQPPLALFLYNDGRQGKLSTGDALMGLKNINEIAVLDAFGKNTPKVFIGPYGLAPSKSYSRFDLPYLSSVDLSSNRAHRKFEDLPFFVAPLSYKTPSGYSKIALPPPHVGSIIVRQSSSSSGNALEHSTFYTRPTAPTNVQYYTPSTLNFDDNATPTKAPITLGNSGKPIYDLDHYSSPTGKPVTAPSANDRGVGNFGSFSNPNPLPASRHPSVNEEYFNLAKTKKPTTKPTLASTTPNYPFRSYGSTRQFDFKPMPDQKIPPSFYPQEEDDTTTTLFTTTTTTERPTTAQLQFEAERMRTHFREENFRSRRPHHHQSTTPASLIETKPQQQQQQQFVHKFKLVDSVRPNNVKSSVVDHGFLDFFNHPSQQHTDEMIKTTFTTSLPGSVGAERQVIRNNYYTASAAVNEDTGANSHSKFVSTYYNPSSTAAGTTTETTTPSTFTTQDVFFRDFDHRSKFYEREPKYETSFPTTVGTTGTSYINKYKYETDTNSDSLRYTVEVVTTSEPSTGTSETTQRTTDLQHYNIPSELPPISANLPGLVNALMDDQWPPKASDTASAAGNTRGPHFRKQLHRTTTQPTSAVDSYDIEPVTTTTRRPLQRQRRPHPSRTTPAPSFAAETSETSGTSTRAPISRSRSRYVPNNEERPSPRGRSRSRTTTPRGPRREEENLDYQRDVLKQNYPLIRPQGHAASASTTTPPSTTIATTTTPSTTLYNQEQYEETSERLFSTTLINEAPQDIGDLQQQVTRKYSTHYSDSTYEQEPTMTTVLPSQTSNYYVPSYSTRSQTDDRPEEEKYVRPQEVIPLNRDPESVHSVIPLRTQNPVTEASPQTAPPAIQYLSEKEESEEKLTTAYGQPLEEAMELTKMEITPRLRRPGLVSRQRETQQNYASRTTTERTTTTRTTTPEPAVSGTGSRTAAGRRPGFVRRPSRLYATTTVSPITTAGYSSEQQQQSTYGTNTVRTKNRQDILRGRTRRPTTTTEPAPAATTASPEAPVTRAFGRGSNLRRIAPTLRSRQEQTAAATTQQPSTLAPVSSGPRFRIRERTRFNLQPQESQWSTKLNQNSFQPVLKTESRTNDIQQENVSTEPEPEIVTAARDNEMYFLNVSSNYGQKDSSKQGANAEDSTETSVSSFADLLNDVMKDFIDANSQEKPERNSNGKDQASTESQRRPVANFRNNILRKRGRSKAVDSFETAESQHINQAAQVYNGPSRFGESLKNIDHVGLSGKNAPQQRERFEEQENTAQEQATVAPAENAAEDTETEEASLEVITGYAEAQTSTTSTPSTITTKITEDVPILVSMEHSSTSLPEQHDDAEVTTGTPTTVEPEAVYNDESSFLAEGEVTKNRVSDGIFDEVKKTISDLYQMAEHDTETEEIIDGGERIDGIENEDVQPTEDPRSLGGSFDEQVTSTTDISPSETQFVQVTAEPPTFINPMGSLVIPTSVSNGITHETEICYRGRCIKTEDDKRKRKFKLN